ncbi:MAG: LytTR family DNA-binding domain-containing protein [Eubacterium sp.]|nr:LytTR family DNA-binding domain-containing protein [Eubacterium sp.]
MKKTDLSVMIIDDDAADRRLYHELTKKYLDAYGFTASIEEIESDQTFAASVVKMEPDIVLLDIYMPGRGGIDIARELRERSGRVQIIFISGSNEFAEEAFEVGAASYLKKPVVYEKFRASMDRAVKRLNLSRTITIIEKREPKRIFISDILYIETESRQLLFHTVGGEIRTYMTLSATMQLLPAGEFVQVNRFQIVPLDGILEAGAAELKLKDGTILMIGAKHADRFQKIYDSYRSGKKNGNG